MRTQHIMAKGQHRTFRMAVWLGRSIGWVLLLIAAVGITGMELLPSMIGGFELVPFVAVGAVGIIWVVGFELFLRFFDRYLSGN